MFSGTTHAHGATTSTSDSRMITAHLAAVVATALVLRRREATAWADARWSAFVSVVVRLLTRAAATARVPGLESRSPEFTRGWSVTSRCPNALPGRRGPPVVA